MYVHDRLDFFLRKLIRTGQPGLRKLDEVAAIDSMSISLSTPLMDPYNSNPETYQMISFYVASLGFMWLH
jgi:hypothetical protein